MSKHSGTTNNNTSAEPKTVLEAADNTTDIAVLELLWEITKRRLDEEKHRQDSANDRASKCITFSFSILATGGVLSVFAKDLLRDGLLYGSYSIHALLILIATSTIALLAFAFKAWQKAADVIDVKNYKTWHETDLSLVSLGDGNIAESKKQHAYLRHQIKSTWTYMPENEKITEEKMNMVASSLRSLQHALVASFILIALGLIANFLVAENMVERNSIKDLGVLSMVNQNNNPKPEPKTITPTPAPSAGQPMKKSEDSPSQTIRPTPKPTEGRPLRENNGGKNEK